MNDQSPWTLLDGLYEWEQKQPEAIYLTQPAGDAVINYSWRQVGEQVRCIARHLESLQLPPGSRIALLSKNCAHWIMADLAIWMAGHASVPIYPSLNAATVRYILDHAEASVLFLGRLDEWQQMRAGVPDRLPIIALPGAPALATRGCLQWDDLVAATAPMSARTQRRQDELATLVYTSGSTGQPKGVMISFGSMAASSQILSTLMPVHPQDRFLSYLPLAHVFEGAAILATSLRYGVHVYFNDTQATFTADLRRARPTMFHSVPRLWIKFQLGVLQHLPSDQLSNLLADPRTAEATRKQVLTQLGLQDVRVAVTGSAPLPSPVLQWYRALGLELLEGYGMSEDFSYSHLSLPGRSRPGYVGHPQPGVERQIAGNGEILIKSPARMSGYYKEPEKTAEAFTGDGYFKTGDMGQIDEDGRLKITGRIKELFKTSKGKYVAPVPIENKLNNHPKVEVVCVLGSGRPQPLALIMLNAQAHLALGKGPDRAVLESELKALIDSVNSTLDPHERLEFVVVVADQWTIANGFLTPTMKIKRDIVENRYEPKFEAWATTKQRVIWE